MSTNPLGPLGKGVRVAHGARCRGCSSSPRAAARCQLSGQFRPSAAPRRTGLSRRRGAPVVPRACPRLCGLVALSRALPTQVYLKLLLRGHYPRKRVPLGRTGVDRCWERLGRGRGNWAGTPRRARRACYPPAVRIARPPARISAARGRGRRRDESARPCAAQRRSVKVRSHPRSRVACNCRPGVNCSGGKLRAGLATAVRSKRIAGPTREETRPIEVQQGGGCK